MRDKTGAAGRRLVHWWRDGGTVTRVAGLLRQVAGMPNYTAYVDHLRRCHPERGIPSEAQFYHEFISARYGDGPTRCC